MEDDERQLYDKMTVDDDARPSVKIISLAFLILIYFSFYQSIHSYWNWTGEFIQLKWESFGKFIDVHPDLFCIIGTIIVICIYWTIGGLFLILDITKKPNFLRKYKIQKGKNDKIELEDIIEIIKQVFVINQVLVGIPMCFLFHKIQQWIIGPSNNKLLPSTIVIFFHLICLQIFYEFAVYFTHRLFHMFKNIHRKHDKKWRAPIAIIAYYNHPLEHIISNIFPTYYGVIILNPHILTSWLHLIIVTIINLINHSGYHLPFLPSPEFHDYHHHKLNLQCYGIYGIIDCLLKTDLIYKKSKEYKRDKILLTLKSAKEVYPEQNNKLKNEEKKKHKVRFYL